MAKFQLQTPNANANTNTQTNTKTNAKANAGTDAKLTLPRRIIQLYNLDPRRPAHEHNLLPLCPRERADDGRRYGRRGL